jgi:hypothetical protein
MDYAIVVFVLGLMVTLVVAKGVMMANEDAVKDRNAREAGKMRKLPSD